MQLGTVSGKAHPGALRFLYLGHLPADSLHRSYAGLAEARQAGDPPLLLLATADTHLTVGAAQTAGAELDFDSCQRLQIPVIQRGLGGGTVWVEPAHLNYFLMAGLGSPFRRPQDLLNAFAPAFLSVHRHFGLDVQMVGGQDFTCAGRRIGSTGAATLGRSLVLGGSFLLAGEWSTFTEALAVPSPGFRVWVLEALEQLMTTWDAELGRTPAPGLVMERLHQELAELGWEIVESCPTELELEAMEAVELEMPDWTASAGRRVPCGIKVRLDSFLTERRWGRNFLRIWTENGCFRRIAGTVFPEELEEAIAGLQKDSPMLDLLLERYLGHGPASLWRERIRSLAVWTDI